MFHRLFARRLAFVIVSVLGVGFGAAGNVSAYPLPTSGQSVCRYPDTGYIASVASTDSQFGYSPYYILEWQACVIQSEGQRKAKIQLSAPDDVYKYKYFSGLVYLDLQACFVNKTYETIASGTGGSATTETGDSSGGRWRFDIINTDWTNLAGNSYRIVITTYNAVVTGPLDLIALSPDGPNGKSVLKTACLTFS